MPKVILLIWQKVWLRLFYADMFSLKAMCGACQGLGKLETFNSKGFPEGAKFCEKCNGTGKRPYTLNEK